MSVDLTVEGAVAKIVLNRPEKLNALNAEMRESLCEHFSRLRYDDAVRVVIVTGAGRGFCSGADVDRMAGQHHDLRGGRQRLQQGGHTFIRALHAIEKPVIAAVRGPAVGIGWSIALACDLVVASKSARFSQIFRRIGPGGQLVVVDEMIDEPQGQRLLGLDKARRKHQFLGLCHAESAGQKPDRAAIGRQSNTAKDLREPRGL